MTTETATALAVEHPRNGEWAMYGFVSSIHPPRWILSRFANDAEGLADDAQASTGVRPRVQYVALRIVSPADSVPL